MTVFGGRVFKEVIKVKKKRIGHRHFQRTDPVQMEGEGSLL